MNRLLAGVVFLGCLVVCPLATFADELDDGPYFGFRFVETRDKQVRVSSVDPKGLAWQMGLRRDDLLVTIGKALNDPNKRDVRSSKDVKDALMAIGKKDGAKYYIVLDRAAPSATKAARMTLKGEIREATKRPGFFNAYQSR